MKTIVIKKEHAVDYTPGERLVIIMESEILGDETVKSTCEYYGISRETYYQWKNALDISAIEIWGKKKKVVKTAEPDKKDEKILELESKISSLKKELELEKICTKKNELIIESIDSKLLPKIPLKANKNKVIDILTNLKHVTLESACKAMDIAVNTYYNWKNEYIKEDNFKKK
jgi:ACT domain-containing protein